MPTPKTVSVQRVIPAAPERIFDLLADPAGHARIDGSGTIRMAHSAGQRLGLGDSFDMSMRLGLPYSIRNVVTEFEENRRIAWQTLMPNERLAKLITGRTWRYELEPVEAGTLVRHTWDLSTEKALTRGLSALMAAATRRNMSATLAKIEELVTA